MASAWGSATVCTSAEEAEALACFNGLAAFGLLPNLNVELESDCQSLIRNLQSGPIDRSSKCFLLRAILGILGFFSNVNVKINWVSRAGNLMAHYLASFAREGMSSGIYSDSAPKPVLDACNSGSVSS